MATGRPGWREVHPLIARELDDRVDDPEPLTPARQSRMTWAARAERTGPIVVKVRQGDRAHEKTQWCAGHLPALGARGYPVPAILWHGMISAEWYVGGLRCLISYRAISGLAHYTRERQSYGSSLGNAECGAISAILDRLQATGYGEGAARLR